VAGNQWGVYVQGYQVRFRAKVAFDQQVDDPALSVVFENEAGQSVFIASTGVEHECSGSFAAGEEAVFSVEFENRLAPGRYYPIASLARRGGGLDLIDRSRREIGFLVQGSAAQGGIVDLPYVSSVERATTGDRPRAEVS
jgi:hypothetical protein